MEAGPLDVLELFGKALQRLFNSVRQRTLARLGKGPEQFLAADDPEHIEAAQGVDREQPFRGRVELCFAACRHKSGLSRVDANRRKQIHWSAAAPACSAPAPWAIAWGRRDIRPPGALHPVLAAG